MSAPHESSADASRRLGWWRVLAYGVTACLVAGICYVAVLLDDAPSLEQLRQVRQAEPSTILASDGTVLAHFRREKQALVPLERISPHVIHALIAVEDHRFRSHAGVDVRRTVSAAWLTLQGDTQGGSTITQQLARNLFPEDIGRARSVHRKVKEWITALRIERIYSKDQILESYLNTVPFLYNVVGIEMAARTYFNRSAQALDPLQAATLVGMLKGTHQYNPVRQPERSLARRNLVLELMSRHGYLDAAQAQAMAKQPLEVNLVHQTELDGPAPHFVAHVRQFMLEWAERRNIDLYADGLVIETPLDLELQALAATAVSEQTALLQGIADAEWSQARLRTMTLPKQASARPEAPFAQLWTSRPDLLTTYIKESAPYKAALAEGLTTGDAVARVLASPDAVNAIKRERTRLEAGFLAMDPRTGEVKAWVGSRDFMADQYDHVAQAARQPGSTFKPFVYGAALESGLSPRQAFYDLPVEIDLGQGRVWKPTDMSAPTGRLMSLRDGLTYSKNTITAQVMQTAGIDRTIALAKALGVSRSPMDPVPSLALGTSPVTLLEMVSAYASMAQLGQRNPPLTVLRVRDRWGREIAHFGEAPRRVMNEDSAIELVDMLRAAVSRGTGRQLKTRFGITADVAGKTGTTQRNTDGWFILMHPDLVAGAWVGFNDARVTMRSNQWGQGGHNAILLVGAFFKDLLTRERIDAKARFPDSKVPVYPEFPGSPAEWGAEAEGPVEPASEPEESDWDWRLPAEPVNGVSPAQPSEPGPVADPAATQGGNPYLPHSPSPTSRFSGAH